MYSIRRYDWTFQIAAILLCSFFLARGVTTYVAGALESMTAAPIDVKPVKAETPSADNDLGAGPDFYKAIVDRDIFNSADTGPAAKETAPDQTAQQQVGELGPAVKTTLDIKVLSTLSVDEGTDKRSSAVVSGGSSKTPQTFSPGDPEGFAPNVKLTKVMKDRIEFVNGGRLEYAELQDINAKKSIFATADEVFGTKEKADASKDKKDDKEATPAEGGKVTIDQKDIDDALQNLDKLYSEVRIVPNYKDGKPSGMKVLSIKPGSLVSKLRIQRGDVLEKINGQDLDMRTGMQMFNTMKDSKNFSLEVERGGKDQTLEYEIR